MEALAERGGVEEKTMKIETNVFDREEKPMDEYIKRDALIKAIKAQFEGRPISEMDKMWNAALSCAIGQVESEPSADVVERKHGKWGQKEVFETKGRVDELQSAFCSVCQRYHTTPYSYYIGGGAEPTESFRESANLQTEESSHRDKQCKEQANRIVRNDGKQRDWKRLEIGGGADQKENGDQRCAYDGRESQQTAKSRDSKWGDYHRRTLAPNENDPRDKDCFWNNPKQTEWSDWRRGCL